MTVAIKQFAFDNRYGGGFHIQGFTSMKLYTCYGDGPVLFHASEYLQGDRWYDYCMARYTDDGNSDCLSPGQVLGFFHYINLCIPTPHYTTKEGLSLDDIQTNRLKDDHMYAVVHSAKKPYINWDRIRNGFVVPFHMGPAQDHIYIIKIENITDALFVFKDYGGKERTKHFCVLPYCQWGQYFSDRVYETDEDGDEDKI